MTYDAKMQNLLDDTRVAIKKGSYLRAFSMITSIEAYALELGVPTLNEVQELNRRASRIAARKELPRVLNKAKRYAGKGDYGHAELVLDMEEHYARDGHLDLPAEFMDLRKQVFQAGLQERLRFIREHYLKTRAYNLAKSSLDIIESTAEKLGLKLPDDAEQLKRELEKLTTSK